MEQQYKVLTNGKQDFGKLRGLKLVEEQNVLNSKGNKPFRVRIFGQVEQNFAVDCIGGEDDIVFAHHQEVVVDIRDEPVVFDIVVEPV